MWNIKAVIAPNLGNYGVISRQYMTITNNCDSSISVQYELQAQDGGKIYRIYTDNAEQNNESKYMSLNGGETSIELVNELGSKNTINIVVEIITTSNCISSIDGRIKVSKIE